jgi:CRP-like cAMP-binding protein
MYLWLGFGLTSGWKVYNFSMSTAHSEPQGSGYSDATIYLGSNALFTGLEAIELESVAQAARPRRLRAGSYLFRQDASATTLYVLLAGTIKMTQLTPEGHQVLLRIVRPGETLGAIAVTGDARYPASAQALSKCS